MKTTKPWKLSVVLLAVFGLLVAGCGSDTADEVTGAAEDVAEETEEAVEEAAEEVEEAAEDAMSDEVAMPGAGVLVTAARANWSTGYFQAALYSALLTELGYEVSDPADAEFPPSNGYTAMAEGEMDFWANSWMPRHFSWFENELTDGSLVGDHVTVVGEEMLASGLEGLLITKAVADEYGIENLAQINDDPELVALFDDDGDGIADIFGCPEDWMCDDIIDETLEFNGWDNLAQVTVAYEVMVAESVNRANAGDPIIQFTWSPSGYLTQLRPGDNVLWLSLGSNDYVLDGSITEAFNFAIAPAAPLGDACTEAECWLGWESADILITANNEFLDANPSARALFEVVQLSVLDVANQNVLYNNGENSEDDVKRHAQDWIAENRETVDGWLDAARAAA